MWALLYVVILWQSRNLSRVCLTLPITADKSSRPLSTLNWIERGLDRRMALKNIEEHWRWSWHAGEKQEDNREWDVVRGDMEIADVAEEVACLHLCPTVERGSQKQKKNS